jgi:pyruvate/2-oxoglutarate/acetoin dehydrogenase E1 component
VPFGKAAQRREGRDLTIITWGATVQKSLEAADRLQAEAEIEVEVVDLRTIIPYDRDAIANSVRKTHRLLVVHEDIVTCGFGAEIAAGPATNSSRRSMRRCAGSAHSIRTFRTNRCSSTRFCRK